MGLFERLRGGPRAPDAGTLYAAVVARGRAPHWYVDGGVPDTINGRFDMIAAILSLVLIRLEAESGSNNIGVALTECFIADMDGQLREAGVGDVGLGKQVGNMVSMLGGRLTAYRAGLGAGDLGPALVRNLYRGAEPTSSAMAHVSVQLTQFAQLLATLSIEAMLGGQLP